MLARMVSASAEAAAAESLSLAMPAMSFPPMVITTSVFLVSLAGKHLLICLSPAKKSSVCAPFTAQLWTSMLGH